MPKDAVEAVSETAAFDRLELSVRRLLDERETLRRRLHAAERRIAELEAAIREVSAGSLDPVALAEHARVLENENRVLEARLTQARDTVQRVLSRLRFAEEES